MKDVSFQLYSARNFPPFANVLEALGEAGYSQVEGYGALYAALSDAEIASFKEGLDSNGLAMPTAHFGLDMLESDPALPDARLIARVRPPVRPLPFRAVLAGERAS